MKKLTAADIPVIDFPIDSMPNLKASLGKASTDTIRFHGLNKNAIGGPRTRWVQNPHAKRLQGLDNMFVDPVVEDVLVGIASLAEGSQKPLSAMRLFSLLKEPQLSTDLLASGMSLDSRQARRYMAAAKLAIFHLNKQKESL
ncbi:hypothetical protein [Pseudomonas phage vB_PaeP_TUMS_P10]|nr:hypothetical protein [Pseudomonas phage vB_PaeS_TUMS_P6]UNI71988.1 hypothetical protein [Pseudomonas phage vB_PaeP_TUMS_P10]